MDAGWDGMDPSSMPIWIAGSLDRAMTIIMEFYFFSQFQGGFVWRARADFLPLE